MNSTPARTRPLAVCLLIALLAYFVAPLMGPQARACTINCIMGNASADGRPIIWKNRDTARSTNYLRYYPSLGRQYDYISIVGGNGVRQGMNSAGFASAHAMANNIDTNHPCNATAMGSFLLNNCSSLESARKMIQYDKKLGSKGIEPGFWEAGWEANCVFMDGHGQSTLIEVGPTNYWEYSPANRNPSFVARANKAHTNAAGQDVPVLPINRDGRYHLATNLTQVAIASTPGIAVSEIIRELARNGGPGQWGISRTSTVSSVIAHGVNEGEDPRIATLWAALGQPDYTCFVPTWVAVGSQLNAHLTDGPQRLADLSWDLFDYGIAGGLVNFDEVINTCLGPLETESLRAVSLARKQWFATGFQPQEAARISDYAANCAWQTMQALSAGLPDYTNMPPAFTRLSLTPELKARTLRANAVVSDPDDGVSWILWDYGDNTGLTPLQSHTYARDGLYLVACLAFDTRGALNVRWQYFGVNASSGSPLAIISFPHSRDLGVGETFLLSGSSSTGDAKGRGYITEYRWDMGDGQILSSPEASHAYRAPGRYTIRLRVTAASGLSIETSTTVKVLEGTYILDNNQPGALTLGAWLPYSGNDCHLGNALLSDSPNDLASYTFLPEPGLYDVFVRWAPLADLSTQARCTVLQGDKPISRNFDQTSNGGVWQLHGTYPAIGGTPMVVSWSGSSAGRVCADAIKLVRK